VLEEGLNGHYNKEEKVIKDKGRRVSAGERGFKHSSEPSFKAVKDFEDLANASKVQP
jgi:hypothetical protein